MAVAAVGGVTLASEQGIGAVQSAAWVVLALVTAVAVAWGCGLTAGAARARRNATEARKRALLTGEAVAAMLAERERVSRGLRESVAGHIEAVAGAGRSGCPEAVLAEARGALAALRALLEVLRDPVGGDDPPPTLPGIAALAARHHVLARYRGTRREVPAAIEVTAFFVAKEILPHEPTVSYLPSGVTVSGRAGSDARRRLRTLADAAGGRMVRSDGAVRVWLPT